MVTRYLGAFSATLRDKDGKRQATLLWGDPVHILDDSGPLHKVQARTWQGYLDPALLTDSSLLELYITDVGQGDGILFKTPDGLWHLMDGGIASREQMMQKGMANFVRWKFIKDLLLDKVALANIIISHPDYDHYGGLLDLLAGTLCDGRTFAIEVQNLYHNGIARFKQAPKLGAKAPGEVPAFPQSGRGVRRADSFITELLGDKASFAGPPRELASPFKELAALAGVVPQNVQRLSHLDQFLPGYAPGQSSVTMRVLGPIMEQFGGGAGLRDFGSDSKTVNGHSVVLRLDYGQARFLLSGDLNAASQKLLRCYHADSEFAVDVAKACHHGSEDIDTEFLRAMGARATIISSGDSEDYSHPRPVLVGAAGRYGRESTALDGAPLAPLVYSTELARSIRLDFPSATLVDADNDPQTPPAFYWPSRIRVKAGVGDNERYRSLRYTPLATDLVYGLVNVRSDGTHILCATMNEKSNDFDIKVFRAGV